MPLAQPLSALRRQLQEQLTEDLASALKSLQALLPENSEKYLAVMALLGRLNDANKARLRNTLSNDDLQREYDRIRAGLLDLVTGLEEADFETPATAVAKASAAKQGNVLYRIPNVMPLEKETRCVVRIALDEDAIVENISLDEHVQLKSLYRVSNTMQAEIFDPSGGRVFHIRSTSEPVQIIDEQGYTEWRFYVTPRLEGAHPLEVKVSIIEMKDGQPSKKEIVLEETVQVVTEGQAPADMGEPMKAAGYALAFQTSAPANVVYEVAEHRLPPAAGRGLRMVAMSLVFLMLSTAAAWAFTSPETRDWWTTRYFRDAKEAYEKHLEKYPQSKHREEAMFRIAEFTGTVPGYFGYLKEYPQGEFKEQAEKAMEALEVRMLEEIKHLPTPSNVRQFLSVFPMSNRLDELKKILEALSGLNEKEALLLEIENAKRLKEGREIGSQELLGKSGDSTISDAATPETGKGKRKFKGSNTPDPSAKDKKENVAQVPVQIGEAPIPDMVFIEKGVFVTPWWYSKRKSNSYYEYDTIYYKLSVDAFYIAKYEVTFDEYDLFCKQTKRKLQSDSGWGRGKRPAIYVSWFDAISYCNWLSEQHSLTPVYQVVGKKVTLNWAASGYRLPTEAEWEYAAGYVGGHKFITKTGQEGGTLDDFAWSGNNAKSKTQLVGKKKPNMVGIADMYGNVAEWCWDWYEEKRNHEAGNRSPKNLPSDPLGPETGKYKVVRGGAWDKPFETQEKSEFNNTRWVYKFKQRMPKGPLSQENFVGFRLVRH